MSPASPSAYTSVDPLCPRPTPARKDGGRYLCPFIRQATDGHSEMLVHSALRQNTTPEDVTGSVWRRFVSDLPPAIKSSNSAILKYIPEVIKSMAASFSNLM